MKRIGVLAYQGDVGRHAGVLRRLRAEPIPVRDPEDLDGISGLIIPGGESTTIGLLLTRFGLGEAIAQRKGLPIFGTCAGAILLAGDITGSDQFRLGLMNIRVERNAYGRQIESFEASFPIPSLEIDDAVGVFIRAPIITAVGPEVTVLAEYEGTPVLVRQGPFLAATFHPELTDDTRIHAYFLDSLG